MKIALLTYSTKPRGGVVHTLALAEALAAAGQEVTVWTLGRGGDGGFFRPVDPAVSQVVVTFPDRDDGHICVSGSVARELRDGWGISATVIPNGVDAGRFAAAAGPSPAAAAARAAWRQRLGRYVLAVGGIEPRKGSIDLLDSFAQLQARPGLRSARAALALVIAGGETLFDYRPYRAAWQARADELGLTPVVLGPVPHDGLPSLVAAAAVFAFPSTVEGFGLAAMEALAAGVPLVTRDLPVLREVFGGAARFGADAPGLAAALGDALGRPDPALTVAGRTLAARHTWAAAAERHLSLYRSLVTQR